MRAAFYIHWWHPQRQLCACNCDFPSWACTSIGSEISCERCRKLHSAWMHRALAPVISETPL